MPSQTRKRLIQAALELFVVQGVSNTTTRQIANLANVNEVTLFRQFGNKFGLVLAVIEESPLFAELETKLMQQFSMADSTQQIFETYTSAALTLFQQVPELIRSVIGEADQYPAEIRQALGQKLAELNRAVAHALIRQSGQQVLPPETIASLLNALLLGYAVIEFSSESHQFWRSQADFLNSLTALFLPELLQSALVETALAAQIETTISAARIAAPPATPITELLPSTVHAILQRAKQAGTQDYALAYVLFATGLSPSEIASLQIANHISTAQHHLLYLPTPEGVRQVSVNQWILGKRYGTYLNNPLTRWLRTRKDAGLALFIQDDNQPISAAKIQQHWQTWTAGLPTDISPIQAQHTWCIEMLMRGMSLENLSVLTGRDKTELLPYVQRAKQKVALEQAAQLDRKPRNS